MYGILLQYHSTPPVLCFLHLTLRPRPAVGWREKQDILFWTYLGPYAQGYTRVQGSRGAPRHWSWFSLWPGYAEIPVVIAHVVFFGSNTLWPCATLGVRRGSSSGYRYNPHSGIRHYVGPSRSIALVLTLSGTLIFLFSMKAQIITLF